MIRRTVPALVAALVLSYPAAGNPNPAALAPSPEQLARARDLVRKLGSAVYREREAATRELFRMGRVALPALAEAVADTADPEVLTRVELLRPKIEAADLRARLDAFLADADGKYDHDLPGWDRFRAVAGTTPDARELFTQFWKSKPNADLLAAVRGPRDELVRRVAVRRMELYTQQYRTTPAGRREQPTVADLAALAFLEGAAGKIDDRRYPYALMQLVVSHPAAREAVRDEGKPSFRRLIVNWLDTRRDAAELAYAVSLAGSLGLKEAPAAKYAARQLDAAGTPPASRMHALTTVARTGGTAYLPVLAKALTDETAQRVVRVGPNGQPEPVDLQVRDVALAMCLLATGQKPEDYGFEARGPAGSEAAKYNYSQYRFADDAKRKAAFEKWRAFAARGMK
jgi:hypothetical protein